MSLCVGAGDRSAARGQEGSGLPEPRLVHDEQQRGDAIHQYAEAVKQMQVLHSSEAGDNEEGQHRRLLVHWLSHSVLVRQHEAALLRDVLHREHTPYEER